MGPRLPNLGASAALNPKRLEIGWLLALGGRGWERGKLIRLHHDATNRNSSIRPHPPTVRKGGGAVSIYTTLGRKKP